MSAPDHILSGEERFLIYLNYLQGKQTGKLPFQSECQCQKTFKEYELYDTERRTHTWTTKILEYVIAIAEEKASAKQPRRLLSFPKTQPGWLKRLGRRAWNPLFFAGKKWTFHHRCRENHINGAHSIRRSSGKP